MSTLNFNLIETELEREKNYWSEKLAGDLVLTSLPPDYQRKDVEPAGYETVALEFDDQIVRKLREVCGKNESLIFTALVTTLKICLYKYTGNEDVIVGTTIHERYASTASLNRYLALRERVNPYAT